MKKIFITTFFIFIFLNNSVFARPILPDVEENNIQLFFLSPLKQAKPKNECKNAPNLTKKYKEHFLELWNSIK